MRADSINHTADPDEFRARRRYYRAQAAVAVFTAAASFVAVAMAQPSPALAADETVDSEIDAPFDYYGMTTMSSRTSPSNVWRTFSPTARAISRFSWAVRGMTT